VVLPNGKRLIFFDERNFFHPQQRAAVAEIYPWGNRRSVRRLQPSSEQPGAEYAALNSTRRSPAYSTPPSTQLGTAQRRVRRLQPNSEQPSAGYVASNPARDSPAYSTPPSTQLGTAQRRVRRLQPPERCVVCSKKQGGHPAVLPARSNPDSAAGARWLKKLTLGLAQLQKGESRKTIFGSELTNSFEDGITKSSHQKSCGLTLVAPLQCNPFTRGRSRFKVIQELLGLRAAKLQKFTPAFPQ